MRTILVCLWLLAPAAVSADSTITSRTDSLGYTHHSGPNITGRCGRSHLPSVSVA